MRRREFITLLGGAVATWPMAARAQQPTRPVVGVLRSTAPDDATDFLGPFRQGMMSGGFTDGENVTIDFRLAENRYDRLPALVADLVRKQPAVIVATGAVNVALAAKAATSTTPIVFVIGSDPVEHGLVASLNRPGGNVTGVTLLGSALMAKRVELLRELVPRVNAIGFLVNPNNANTEMETKELQMVARANGWTLHVVPANTERDLDTALATLVRLGAGAFLHSTDIFFTSQYPVLVTLEARYKLPSIYGRRDGVTSGGLVSYGARVADVYRLAATYTVRILKGEKPADLPVQLPTIFELVINMKTARAMGITVPTSILLRADEVIE